MLLLTPILLVPLLAGLLCLLVPSRRVMAALGVLAFAATLGLGIALLHQVLARGRGDRVERVSLRRCPQRLDGAAHLGRVAGHLALRRALLSARPGGGRSHAGTGARVLRAHAALWRGDVSGGAGQQPGRDVGRRGGHRAVLRAAGGALQPHGPRSKPPGNTSSSAAWAWRWRCSARCSSMPPPAKTTRSRCPASTGRT